MTRAKTLLRVKPAPIIASLSSRGPNLIQPTILKVLSLFHHQLNLTLVHTLNHSLICSLEIEKQLTNYDFYFHFQPDITAPGVDILYAGSEAASPTGLALDNCRIPYNVGSGTSVACPHVSGTIGLLKRLYPNWSPAALKSALMTTGIYRVQKSFRVYTYQNDIVPQNVLYFFVALLFLHLRAFLHTPVNDM